ncbi:MAG: hypothetical protein FJY67_09460 [Calditrichaeota bacterium]|nr:hypothetical protein [Calditrichota bacterium]
MRYYRCTVLVSSMVALNLMVTTVDAAGPGTFVYPPYKHTWGVVKARPLHLRLFLGYKTKFDDPQGLACARLDAWEDPSREGDDDEVTVYGVNSGDKCIIYNRSMYALGLFGKEGRGEALERPWGIAADRWGQVYVVDRGRAEVHHLRNGGKSLVPVRKIGRFGDGEGEFIDPIGAALLPDGSLLVTDAALGRVTMFDSTGAVRLAWEGLLSPAGIAATGPGESWTYFDQDAFVVVIDSAGQRVSKFDLKGQLVKRTRTEEWEGDIGIEHLEWLALDYHNQVLITDRTRGCIHKLDRNLNYLDTFGETGDGDYRFDEPRGIALYRRFGQIFVAERPGAQYLWVGVDVRDLQATVVSDSIWRDLRVSFFLTEPALVDVDVEDAAGRFIARLMENRRFDAGKVQFFWNLMVPAQLPGGKPLPTLPASYDVGKRLPSGRYSLRATFRATYSSRESFSIERKTGFGL